MRIEYGDIDIPEATPENPATMVVFFETPEDWYSLIYDDSWIAKAIRAHRLPSDLWGNHLKKVIQVTFKDLDAEEQLLFTKIKTILKENTR